MAPDWPPAMFTDPPAEVVTATAALFGCPFTTIVNDTGALWQVFVWQRT